MMKVCQALSILTSHLPMLWLLTQVGVVSVKVRVAILLHDLLYLLPDLVFVLFHMLQLLHLDSLLQRSHSLGFVPVDGYVGDPCIRCGYCLIFSIMLCYWDFIKSLHLQRLFMYELIEQIVWRWI